MEVLIMRELYTSVGRFCRRGHGDFIYPYVNINGKDYTLDMQEMTVWVLLNWRILDLDQLKSLYEAHIKKAELPSLGSITDCVNRLTQRGLVVSGKGETGADALYNLLSGLYIVPISENPLLRFFSFLRLTLFHGVPYSVARKLLVRDKRSSTEQQIIHLSKQTLLSTAEIIRCAELQVSDLPTEEAVLDALYGDDITTSDNLADTVRYSRQRNNVLAAISNLYLRRQITFERI